MKKHLFSFVFILISATSLQAQNWQTFISSGDAFFISKPIALNTHQIQAFHSDSVELVSSDSLFHLFETFKDTLGLCIYDNRASWLGDKILIKANGKNVFFNEKNDSIKINTFAQLNDSFPVYTYQNGDIITAVVTTFSIRLVLGIPDSIKEITLHVSDALGNSISSFFNGQKFSLSKNSGIISTFSWREFPYSQDTLLNILSDYHRVTYADIYDYNVGDIFQTHGNSIQVTGPGVYINYEIIAKWYSTAMDTVFYGEAVTSKNYTFTWLPSPHLDSTITFFSDTIFYTNLTSYLYNGKYPNEVIRDTSLTFFGGLTDYSMYTDSAKFNGRLNLSNMLINYFWDGSCFEQPFEINEQTFGYIVGCGSFEMGYYNTTTGAPEGGNIYLIYYKKGTEIYGTSQFVTGVNEVQNNIQQLSLFPNPANSFVNIKYDFGYQNNGWIELLDIQGRIIFKQRLYWSSKEIILHTNAYENGLYQIRVSDDTGRIGSGKLILQH